MVNNESYQGQLGAASEWTPAKTFYKEENGT